MSTFTPTRPVPGDGVLDRPSCTRRGLLLFFAILIPLSLLFETATFITHNLTWVLALMGVPALSSVILLFIPLPIPMHQCGDVAKLFDDFPFR